MLLLSLPPLLPQVSPPQLMRTARETDYEISVGYSRLSMIKVLSDWPQGIPLTPSQIGTASSLCQLIRITCGNGQSANVPLLKNSILILLQDNQV